MGYKSDKSSPVTGDRITNALKGDKDKYRENWDKVFGNKSEEDNILDEITQRNQDMGLYDGNYQS